MNFGAVVTLITIWTVINAQFNFTAVPETAPMIVNKLADAHLTYDSFKLVFFAGLTPMFQLKHNIKHAVDTVTNLTVIIGKPSYKTAANQLKHQWQLMLDDNELLESFRVKRSFTLCEFCGKIQKVLYGVMDAATARKYDEIINGIRNVSIENREIMRNQSEIFQNTLHLNKDTFERIDTNIRNIVDRMNNQTDDIKRIRLELSEQSLIQNAQLMISEYYRIFGQVRRALSETRYGKISELVPKIQLLKELRYISTKLKRNQRLPINLSSEDVFHIFRYSQTRSTLFRNNIIVEVTIPISENERLALFKATPIPTCINDTCIIPTVHSKYFLTNTEYSVYVPMDQKQLDAGKQMANKDILYRPTATTLLNSEGICEWQVLKNKPATELQKACEFAPFLQKNAIFTIMENEIIFVSMSHNTTVYEACNGTEFVQKILVGRGMIQLDSDCLFKTENYLVRPHKIVDRHEVQTIIPVMPLDDLDMGNFTNDVLEKLKTSSDYISSTAIIQNPEQLHKIMEQTELLVKNARQEIKLDEIHYDSATTSWFSGIISASTIFGIILTVGGAIFYKCNMFGCLLRAIIKKSTFLEVEEDGALAFDMPANLAPTLNANRSIHEQSNEQATNSRITSQSDHQIPMQTLSQAATAAVTQAATQLANQAVNRAFIH